MTEIGIKFRCDWVRSEPLDENLIIELDEWRNRIYDLKLIGEDLSGIGYGNISKRFSGKEFIISGATTGKLRRLTQAHYTKVVDFSISSNSLKTVGPIIASSESLTHAIIYTLDKRINAVIHVHHAALWKKHLHKLPTTDVKVEYGTPDMAKEIIRLYNETDLARQKVLSMAGHQNGLISFGTNLKEAAEVLINLLNQIND